MGLLDSIGKKMSDAGQKTIQKTREMSDTVKINVMISEEEKRINNLYYQIGKLYVSLHGSDCDPDFQNMIEGLCESEQKIQKYRLQIQEIKGVQRCKNCGAEVQRGIAFCSSCGARINADASVDVVRCRYCGAEVKKGMRFCTNCGKSMDRIEELGLALDEISQTQSVLKCSKCGMELDEGSLFCPECGTRVQVDAFSKTAEVNPSDLIQSNTDTEGETSLQESSVPTEEDISASTIGAYERK